MPEEDRVMVTTRVRLIFKRSPIFRAGFVLGLGLENLSGPGLGTGLDGVRVRVRVRARARHKLGCRLRLG